MLIHISRLIQFNFPVLTRRVAMATIDLFSVDLKNKNGIVVGVLPFGATIQRILLPRKGGSHIDVVQGYENVQGYEEDHVYYGALVGRFANRIGNATYTLDGLQVKLPENRPGVCLHGGVKGFNKKTWKIVDALEQSVTLELVSPDGDEGFPGELTVRVMYSLNDENELHLKYQATTSKPTVVNLTNHSYFNLAGHNADTILEHQMQLFADKYLPKKPNNCPSGETPDVADTPFDFRNPTRIGDRIDKFLPQDIGLDHSWLVRGFKSTKGCNECRPVLPAARIVDPASGRWLLVSTNDVVCHVYSGNYLNNVHGKDGAVHNKYSAFCIETSGCPDAPNVPNLPSTVLRPGELFTHHTVWKFGGF